MRALSALDIAILICSHQPSAMTTATRLTALIGGQLREHGQMANINQGDEK